MVGDELTMKCVLDVRSGQPPVPGDKIRKHSFVANVNIDILPPVFSSPQLLVLSFGLKSWVYSIPDHNGSG